MTRMTGPDCVVMCNLINTHTHTHTHTHTQGTLIPHASPSLQTGGGACEHPTAPCARPGVGTSASHRGGNRIRGAGRSKRGRGRDWSRGGDGDGNGDVNGHEDGDGAGAGTGVEVNEGA